MATEIFFTNPVFVNSLRDLGVGIKDTFHHVAVIDEAERRRGRNRWHI